MTSIERHWNKDLLKNWGTIIMIALILQCFFQGIREIKLLSDTYRFFDLMQYLAGESFVFTIEFFPITLFIAAISLQDRWKKNDYFLNALLDGVTLARWRGLSFRNALLNFAIWIPMWFFVLPNIYYHNIYTRLVLLKKTPQVDSDKIYLINNNLAYIESAPMEQKILDLEQNLLLSEVHHEKTLKTWKEKFIDFQIGMDKVSMYKKINYLQDTRGKEHALVIGSLLRDVLYICALGLCWLFISLDREYKMFSTKRDQFSPNWIKRFSQTISLYWMIKIIPLLARFFNPWPILFGSIAIILSTCL